MLFLITFLTDAWSYNAIQIISFYSQHCGDPSYIC